MFETLSGNDLIQFVNRGLELKQRSLSLSDSRTTAEHLIAAGYANIMIEKGSSALANLPVDIVTKMKNWISVVVKAAEFKGELILSERSKLVVEPAGDNRGIFVVHGENAQNVAIIQDEGKEARFLIFVAQDLCLWGSDLIEYAKAEVNSLCLYKMYGTSQVLHAAIGLRLESTL